MYILNSVNNIYICIYRWIKQEQINITIIIIIDSVHSAIVEAINFGAK